MPFKLQVVRGLLLPMCHWSDRVKLMYPDTVQAGRWFLSVAEDKRIQGLLNNNNLWFGLSCYRLTPYYDENNWRQWRHGSKNYLLGCLCLSGAFRIICFSNVLLIMPIVLKKWKKKAYLFFLSFIDASTKIVGSPSQCQGTSLEDISWRNDS